MYSNPYNSFWTNLFSSKITLSVLVVILAFISFSIYKEKRGQETINSSLSRLEQEIAVLEHQNLSLTDMIKYLQTDRFVEFEAREKLGFQKPGEKVVIIPNESGVIAGANLGPDTNLPNYIKWLKYFFE